MADENDRAGSPAHMPGAHAVWQRAVHFLHPVVYRCMEDQYIEAFLRRGELRLSSFAAFRKYRDEQRGDPQEGSIMSFGHRGAPAYPIDKSAQYKAFQALGSSDRRAAHYRQRDTQRDSRTRRP